MSLLARATNEASTLRAKVASGKRQAPATHLEGLLCTPLYPAGGETGSLVEQGILQSLMNVFVAFVVGAQDIVPGDVLSTGGAQYTVALAATWTRPGGVDSFTHLTVQKVLQ